MDSVKHAFAACTASCVGVKSLSVPPKDPNGVRLAAQMKMPRFSMMERGVEDLGGRWKLH